MVDGCGRKSNSFKLLYKSLLPARMRNIHSKLKVLEWSQQISHCKSRQIFYDAQGKLTPQSKVGSTQIKVIQVFMVAFVPCKNEKVPIINEGARVVTILSINF